MKLTFFHSQNYSRPLHKIAEGPSPWISLEEVKVCDCLIRQHDVNYFFISILQKAIFSVVESLYTLNTKYCNDIAAVVQRPAEDVLLGEIFVSLVPPPISEVHSY